MKGCSCVVSSEPLRSKAGGTAADAIHSTLVSLFPAIFSYSKIAFCA